MITGRRSNNIIQGIPRPQNISNSTREQDIPHAQYYFIMSRNLVDWTTLPNFVVGRVAYDNALVYWAYHNAHLIDATQTILALHQSTADGNREWSQNPDEDLAFNTEQEGGSLRPRLLQQCPCSDALGRDTIEKHQNTRTPLCRMFDHHYEMHHEI